MTITFEDDNDLIIYALEKVISYTRRSQHIFVAQCGWWLASVIELESGLVNHINKLYGRTTIKESGHYQDSPLVQEARIPDPAKAGKEKYHTILKECEQYLQESKRLRNIATQGTKRSTRTDRINPTRVSKKFLDKKTRWERRNPKPVIDKEYNISKTAGLDKAEIQRRKVKGECLRCAWPSDRKGAHRVKDCIRPIKLEEGIAGHPKGKEYQRSMQVHQEPLAEEDSSENTSSDQSLNESL